MFKIIVWKKRLITARNSIPLTIVEHVTMDFIWKTVNAWNNQKKPFLFAENIKIY